MVSQLSSGKVQRQTDTCNNRVLMYRIIYFMPCLCLPQFSHLYDGELWMPSFLCTKLLSKHPAELGQVTTQQKDIHGNKFHPTCKVQTLLFFLKPFSSRDNLYFFLSFMVLPILDIPEGCIMKADPIRTCWHCRSLDVWGICPSPKSSFDISTTKPITQRP